MRCAIADLLTDLLIYIGTRIITSTFGRIPGYHLPIVPSAKRFMVLASGRSNSDSSTPIVNGLARET